MILNDLPVNLKLKVKGLGFDLMAYKLKLKKPSLKIDLSRLKIHQNKKDQNLTIASDFYMSYLSNQLGEQIEIKEIYPDSIHFIFDDKKEKTLKIIPLTQIEFEKQYQLFGKLLVKPAITKVSGPASIIDTLNEVYTENITYTNLSETITESVGFNPVYNKKRLTFNPDKIILHIPVEKYTESAVTIPIDYINVPDSIKIKAIPNEVELKFMIPLSKMASLPSAKFKAEIDYSQINDNISNKLKVSIIQYPTYIQSLTLNPAKVEYILKKQN